jgi:hypothetical protein
MSSEPCVVKNNAPLPIPSLIPRISSSQSPYGRHGSAHPVLADARLARHAHTSESVIGIKHRYIFGVGIRIALGRPTVDAAMAPGNASPFVCSSHHIRLRCHVAPRRQDSSPFTRLMHTTPHFQPPSNNYSKNDAPRD